MNLEARRRSVGLEEEVLSVGLLSLLCLLQGRTAWSNSDTDDDDDMALLGIAVEGAVSPGAESEEEPQG